MEEATGSAAGDARRPPGPRLYHKKSRMGCLRCKARRVKCDEKRPSCTGCSRHQVECIYRDLMNGYGPATTGAAPAAPAAPPPPSRRLRPSMSSSSGSSRSPGEVGVSPVNTSSTYESNTELRDSESAMAFSPAAPRLPVASSSASSIAMGPPPSASPPLDVHMSDYSASSLAGWQQQRQQQQQQQPSQRSYQHQRQRQYVGFGSGEGEGDEEEMEGGEDEDDPLDPPESRERRVTELSLLHDYLMVMSQTFERPVMPPEAVGRPARPQDFLWSVDMVQMALEDDSLLYALLAHAALSRWVRAEREQERGRERDLSCLATAAAARERDRRRYRGLQQQYLAMALRAQRRAVASLSAATADYVCFSSLMLVNHSFALVQTLPADPWQPPSEWLQMGRGAGQVLTVARGHLVSTPAGSPSGGRMARFANTPPRFDPDELFAPANAAHLLRLLDPPAGCPPDRELDDKVTRGVYERVLRYVGWCERAAADPAEPLSAVVRRLAAAAVWFPEFFQGFLAQRRPRALVALARFFALWVPLEGRVWMVGPTGARQLRSIYAALHPPAWREKLDPLMDELGLR